MLKLWFDRDIRLASCMHATCEVEYNHIRDFGYKGPVAIIGNPVNVPPFIDEIFLHVNAIYAMTLRQSPRSDSLAGCTPSKE